MKQHKQVGPENTTMGQAASVDPQTVTPYSVAKTTNNILFDGNSAADAAASGVNDDDDSSVEIIKVVPPSIGGSLGHSPAATMANGWNHATPLGLSAKYKKPIPSPVIKLEMDHTMRGSGISPPKALPPSSYRSPKQPKVPVSVGKRSKVTSLIAPKPQHMDRRTVAAATAAAMEAGSGSLQPPWTKKPSNPKLKVQPSSPASTITTKDDNSDKSSASSLEASPPEGRKKLLQDPSKRLANINHPNKVVTTAAAAASKTLPLQATGRPSTGHIKSSKETTSVVQNSKLSAGSAFHSVKQTSSITTGGTTRNIVITNTNGAAGRLLDGVDVSGAPSGIGGGNNSMGPAVVQATPKQKTARSVSPSSTAAHVIVVDNNKDRKQTSKKGNAVSVPSPVAMTKQVPLADGTLTKRPQPVRGKSGDSGKSAATTSASNSTSPHRAQQKPTPTRPALLSSPKIVAASVAAALPPSSGDLPPPAASTKPEDSKQMAAMKTLHVGSAPHQAVKSSANDSHHPKTASMTSLNSRQREGRPNKSWMHALKSFLIATVFGPNATIDDEAQKLGIRPASLDICIWASISKRLAGVGKQFGRHGGWVGLAERYGTDELKSLMCEKRNHQQLLSSNLIRKSEKEAYAACRAKFESALDEIEADRLIHRVSEELHSFRTKSRSKSNSKVKNSSPRKPVSVTTQLPGEEAPMPKAPQKSVNTFWDTGEEKLPSAAQGDQLPTTPEGATPQSAKDDRSTGTGQRSKSYQGAEATLRDAIGRGISRNDKGTVNKDDSKTDTSQRSSERTDAPPKDADAVQIEKDDSDGFSMERFKDYLVDAVLPSASFQELAESRGLQPLSLEVCLFSSISKKVRIPKIPRRSTKNARVGGWSAVADRFGSKELCEYIAERRSKITTDYVQAENLVKDSELDQFKSLRLEFAQALETERGETFAEQMSGVLADESVRDDGDEDELDEEDDKQSTPGKQTDVWRGPTAAVAALRDWVMNTAEGNSLLVEASKEDCELEQEMALLTAIAGLVGIRCQHSYPFVRKHAGRPLWEFLRDRELTVSPDEAPARYVKADEKRAMFTRLRRAFKIICDEAPEVLVAGLEPEHRGIQGISQRDMDRGAGKSDSQAKVKDSGDGGIVTGSDGKHGVGVDGSRTDGRPKQDSSTQTETPKEEHKPKVWSVRTERDQVEIADDGSALSTMVSHGSSKRRQKEGSQPLLPKTAPRTTNYERYQIGGYRVGQGGYNPLAQKGRNSMSWNRGSSLRSGKKRGYRKGGEDEWTDSEDTISDPKPKRHSPSTKYGAVALPKQGKKRRHHDPENDESGGSFQWTTGFGMSEFRPKRPRSTTLNDESRRQISYFANSYEPLGEGTRYEGPPKPPIVHGPVGQPGGPSIMERVNVWKLSLTPGSGTTGQTGPKLAPHIRRLESYKEDLREFQMRSDDRFKACIKRIQFEWDSHLGTDAEHRGESEAKLQKEQQKSLEHFANDEIALLKSETDRLIAEASQEAGYRDFNSLVIRHSGRRCERLEDFLNRLREDAIRFLTKSPVQQAAEWVSFRRNVHDRWEEYQVFEDTIMKRHLKACSHAIDDGYR